MYNIQKQQKYKNTEKVSMLFRTYNDTTKDNLNKIEKF